MNLEINIDLGAYVSCPLATFRRYRPLGFDAVSAPSCQSVELPSSFDGSWHKHIDESLANKEEYTCSGRDEQ